MLQWPATQDWLGKAAIGGPMQNGPESEDSITDGAFAENHFIARRGGFPDYAKWDLRTPTPCEICVQVLTSNTLSVPGSQPVDCQRNFHNKVERFLCEYVTQRALNVSDDVQKWRNIGCSETAWFDSNTTLANQTLNQTVPDLLNPKSLQYFGDLLPSSLNRLTPCPARYVCSWFGVANLSDRLGIKPVGNESNSTASTLDVSHSDSFQALDAAMRGHQRTRVANARGSMLYGDEVADGQGWVGGIPDYVDPSHGIHDWDPDDTGLGAQ